jgi:8-oxo-dGTP pyrophosphatase MutT (NUDIX family)
MQSSVMGAGKSRTPPPSVKLFRLSHVRKLRECEQVAAVCYRVRGGGIEFLLVRTSSGHWTFPKGRVEPGLTHAQAAAIEAFEEAGVHGRIEEASFGRYVRRERGKMRNSSSRSGGKSAEKETVISAHLCEVLRLGPPQEADRNPTWFSPGKAKRRLQEDRTPDFGAELARVVDRAVARIHGWQSATSSASDALRRVHVEASEGTRTHSRIQDSSYPRLASGQPDSLRPSNSLAVGRRLSKLVKLGPVLVASGAPAGHQALTGSAASNRRGLRSAGPARGNPKGKTARS